MLDLTTASPDKICGAYIALRDKIAEIEAQHKAALAPYKDAKVKLEQAMLNILVTQGVESMRTASGTAYRTERTSVTIADKSAFMDYVTNNGAFELLDVRANKTAVADFLTENQDLPPGVNVSREATVGFRRA